MTDERHRFNIHIVLEQSTPLPHLFYYRCFLKLQCFNLPFFQECLHQSYGSSSMNAFSEETTVGSPRSNCISISTGNATESTGSRLKGSLLRMNGLCLQQNLVLLEGLTELVDHGLKMIWPLSILQTLLCWFTKIENTDILQVNTQMHIWVYKLRWVRLFWSGSSRRFWHGWWQCHRWTRQVSLFI